MSAAHAPAIFQAFSMTQQSLLNCPRAIVQSVDKWHNNLVWLSQNCLYTIVLFRGLEVGFSVFCCYMTDFGPAEMSFALLLLLPLCWSRGVGSVGLTASAQRCCCTLALAVLNAT